MTETIDADLADLLNGHNAARDNRNQEGKTDSDSKDNSSKDGSDESVYKFSIFYKNRPEDLRKTFCGDDTVKMLLQAIKDEIIGGESPENEKDSYGAKRRLEVVWLKKVLNKPDEQLKNLPKPLPGPRPPLFVTYEVIGGAYSGSNDDSKENENGKEKERVRMADFKNEKRIKPTLEPDCIYGFNERKLRVKMPCGHVFDSNTIFKCVKMYVENLSKSKILCPVLKCKQEWPFDVVIAAADLNEIESRNFFNILSKRALIHSGDFQECPGCKGLVSKPKAVNMMRVRCQEKSCSNRSDFCWICSKDWIGGGFTVCGNKDCQSNSINEILSSCGTIKPDYLNNKVDVPSIRVCPRCYTLVKWGERCKHIKCWGCNKEFCYICLTLKGDNGWSDDCANVALNCGVAARQSLK